MTVWTENLVLVTVQMDPYPFPPHVTPHATLRQVPWKERHDLALDHANEQFISLSIALSQFSFLDRT